MNRIQRTRLEQELFYKAHYDPEVKDIVLKRLENYKKLYIENEVHEAEFGMKYCEALLQSGGTRIPYKKLMEATGNEPTTSYYFYRRLVLEKINKELKAARKNEKE